MTEATPRSLGRRIFNVLAAVVLTLFALFVVGMAVGVASIPALRRAAERAPSPTSHP
ncbi:MAG TPA: hypothetical protein VK661_08650 [Planctomycetota bacterium]|nr:hypothetical protein [Planctomycetota bacterium]